MIWMEKYRPKSFDEMVGKKELVEMAKSYNLNNIPCMIIHGQSGNGKKTLLHCLIQKLYGNIPDPKIKKIEIQSGSKKIDVEYLESNEYVEICPSDYDFQDRAVVQGVIKEMAQAKPILSMFSKISRPSVKLIVITSAEDLSYEAQASLRRTIEMYSSSFRVILICNELSRLIEPIRSRCIFVRVPGFSDIEIKEHIRYILKNEDYSVDEDVIDTIVKKADGNMRRAICMLELYCFNKGESTPKRTKLNEEDFKMDWEVSLSSIANLMKTKQTSESLITIRKDLYTLLNSCISPRTILIRLARLVSSANDFNRNLKIYNQAIIYDERMRAGTKSIYHLEAFIASAMCILSGAQI